MLQIHLDKNVHFLSVRLSFYHVLGKRAIISGRNRNCGSSSHGAGFWCMKAGILRLSQRSHHAAAAAAKQMGGTLRRIKNAVDPLQDARQSCYKTGRALRFVFPGKVPGVQGTGGVEHGQHHHAHIGKDGGPHAGHADRAQHKAGELDGQCKHDVLIHDA
jgi:hypothetical protein